MVSIGAFLLFVTTGIGIATIQKPLLVITFVVVQLFTGAALTTPEESSKEIPEDKTEIVEDGS